MTVALAATEYGSGRPIAILHGLFGSGRNWAGIARRLAQRHRVIAFDLRNHGASPWADTMSYAEMAEDVRAAMRAHGHRAYTLIGHSLGGKVAMVAALAGGVEIERLVVVDIAPVTYSAGHAPYVRAMRGLDLGAITRRGDADRALAAAVPNADERAFLLQSLVVADTPRWQLNLAAIEQALPALCGFPAFPAGTAYHGPALFIAGDNSDYLPPAHEAAARRYFPDAAFQRIAAAGHWVHAEQPELFLRVVEPFVA